MSCFSDNFDDFVQDYIDQSNEENKGLLTIYSNDWQSPCIEQPANDGDFVSWRPAKRSLAGDFKNLEHALDLAIPTSIQEFYGRYFSLDLNASCSEGDLTLLQTWNDFDYERVQKNLIAHVLMKRRLKQSETLFFALTDIEDIIVSIDVKSEQVVVERVGQPPHKVLAESLSQFIVSLNPKPSFVEL